MKKIVLLQHTCDVMFEAIYAMYENIFPKSEQKTKENFKKVFNNQEYSIFIIQKNTDVLGFCIFFAPKSLDFILLEYMAIKENLRSFGMGSELFLFSIKTLFLQNERKPILIEIDSPHKNDENAISNQKRANFYRKNGCKVVNDFEYILGLKSELLPPKMEMLIYGYENEFIVKNQLKSYVQDIYEKVYFNDRNHLNIDTMFSNVNEKIMLM